MIPEGSPPPDTRLDLLALLTPIVEGWRLLLLGAVALPLVVGVVILSSPRRYRAEVAVAPVLGGRVAPNALGNLAATLTGAGLSAGFQLTPQRLVELIRSRGVATDILFAPAVEGGNERVGDRLLGQPTTPERAESAVKALQNTISAEISRETGTVTVRVGYRDSALARRINGLLVNAASRAFVASAKAQASQLRLAQDRRVDSAQRRIGAAEATLIAFLSRNRQISPFSTLGVERDRLQRDVTLAQQVYLQAAADREAAVAKELEATPTVVVVDPLPEVLPGVRRRLITKTGLAFFIGGLIMAVLLVLRDLARQRLAERDSSTRRFLDGVRSTPLGRLLRIRN